ncbi:MAG: hypothetical protein IT452_21255 [Planctomycetia bacterium]|nr:hypothetical protein [Planctomycetia bacterium]
MRSVSFGGAVTGMLGLRVRRFFSRLGAFYRSKGKARAGGPSKRAGGMFSSALVLAMMLGVGASIAFGAVKNMTQVLGHGDARAEAVPEGWTPEAWKSLGEDAQKVYREALGARRGLGIGERTREPAVVDGLAFLSGVLLLMMGAMVIGVAASDAGRLDQDVEWMLSLPVSARAIYAAKAAERTLLNFPGWFSLGPLVAIAAAAFGQGWASLAWGAAAALAGNVVVAGVTAGVELASHRLLGATGRRNLQAAAGLAQVVLMLVAMAYGTAAGRADSVLYDLARECGAFARWLPGGLVLGMAHGGRAGLLQAGALALWIAGAAVAGAFAAEWAAARGLEAVQSGPGRRGASRGAAGSGGLLFKEIQLLLRDRVLLVQVAALPLVFAAAQVLMNPDFFRRMLDSPQLSAAAAFGIGAYTLLSAAPGVLFHERDALWLLYTFPRPVGSVVLRKALLWTGIAVAWAALAMGAAVWKRGGPVPGDLLGAAWIAIGLPAYALVAASVGVLGFDPAATEMHRRIRFDLQYLLMLLGGLLGAGLWLPAVHERGGALALFLVLGVAMWKRASERFETLLDPAADRPRRVEAADGLVAALLALYVESFVARGLTLEPGLDAPTARALAEPFATAFALVVVLVVVWRNGLRLSELPALVPGRAVAAGGVAAALGLAAAAGAAGWDALLARLGGTPAVPGWFAAPFQLAATPFVVPYLFAGLVYAPLRRFLGFPSAAFLTASLLAAGALPAAFVPALLAGLAIAAAQEFGKGVLAPMLAMAVFEASLAAVRLSS